MKIACDGAMVSTQAKDTDSDRKDEEKHYANKKNYLAVRLRSEQYQNRSSRGRQMVLMRKIMSNKTGLRM